MRAYAMPTFRLSRKWHAIPTATRAITVPRFSASGRAVLRHLRLREQEIIDDILNQFEKYLHFLHISPGVLPWKMEEHDDMINSGDDGAPARP
jgi:choline/glycine/proline betaine transport protein